VITITFAIGLLVGGVLGMFAHALVASGSCEDAYRKGFLGGYRKARRDDEAD